MSQLNAALERKNASERKINSKKRYNRASEDPISAAKALRTRKAISNTNDYLANLETAEQIYNGADSVLMNVNDILDNIIEKVTYAANGTQHDEDEEILAQTVETFADEIVRLFNTDIAERRIFGGVNNDTTVFKIENAADHQPDVVDYRKICLVLLCNQCYCSKNTEYPYCKSDDYMYQQRNENRKSE